VSFSHGLRALVVDASVAVAFVRGEDGWPQRWDEWAASNVMLLAPAHFMFESANAFLLSVRLPPKDAVSAIDQLASAGVETADRGLSGLKEAMALAVKHGLTVYDALYLQLALEIDCELATIDADLRRAAVAEGIAVV